MLIEPQRARDVKLELFEQTTVELLQAELEEWLSSREEELIIGLSFEGEAAAPSYRAAVLYTE